MSALSDIAGAVAGGAAGANPVSVLGGLADDIFNAIFPSPEKKQAAIDAGIKTEVDAYVAKRSVDMQEVMAQIGVDTAEASNPSMFVAGARPFILWVCGVALAWDLLVAPLATWITSLFGHTVAYPQLDGNLLTTLLFGMLGLSAQRTYEKVKGVDTTVIGGTAQPAIPALKTGLSWLKRS